MKNQQSDISNPFDVASALLVNPQRSESGASTPLISDLETGTYWNSRGVSQAPTGPSLLLSDDSIPKSTYDCYSSKTITQQSSSDSAIPSGPISRDFNGPLGKSYPKSGSLSVQVAGSHYRQMKIQPVEFIIANDIPFLAANIIKYAARYKNKGGANDIRKIMHYCRLILEFEYDETEEVSKS